MKGKWLFWVRKTHLYLSVFFAPLLLMFIITGWVQTVAVEDKKKSADTGFIHVLTEKFSRVHTDSYYPSAAASSHSHFGGKVLIVAMCIALIISITMGLVLAWQLNKNKTWVLGAFVLGIVVPALLFYFA